MTDKEKSRILNLFTEYEGKIFETDNHITIENTNMISDGIKAKRVLCTVRIVHYNRRELFQWSVEAEERGLEILGGCGLPCDDLDEALRKAERQLEKYNFKRVEQTKLF